MFMWSDFEAFCVSVQSFVLMSNTVICSADVLASDGKWKCEKLQFLNQIKDFLTENLQLKEGEHLKHHLHTVTDTDTSIDFELFLL